MGLFIAGFCVGIVVAVILCGRHIYALEKRMECEWGLPDIDISEIPPMPKCKDPKP